MKTRTVSLRLRLAVGYTALLAVIIGAFAVVLFFGMQRALLDEMDKRLEVRAEQLAQLLQPKADGATSPQSLAPGPLDVSALTNLDDPVVYAQVRDLQGKLIASSESLQGDVLPIDQSEIRRVLAGEHAIRDLRAGDRSVRSLASTLDVRGQPAAILQVAESRRSLSRTLGDLRLLLILLGVAACGGAGLLGWFITRRGLRPLEAISAQASSIARKRDFERRLDVPVEATEVDLLASTINELLSTVDAVLSRHREFLADTSHELRNPLLAVSGNLELLGLVDDPQAREECVREARQQVARMTRLVGDLLSLAQIEAGLLIEPKAMDLAVMADRTVRTFQQRVGDRHFVVRGPEHLLLEADEGRLEQVITNLLDNAIRHTRSGGNITVELGTDDDFAVLSVADDGEGIAPEHLPRLFQRFFRVDSGPSSETGRMGFGLPIVKRLVEGHGGHVSVESQPGKGARFTVYLPFIKTSSTDHVGTMPAGHTQNVSAGG